MSRLRQWDPYARCYSCDTLLGLNRDRVCIVSGIGCSSRAAGYMNFSTVHTTHGRAIPFATGVKLADPTLEVIVITGDGDLAAIGGNHFIHACRRNIGLTVVVFNNEIYGMTGGQYSPTTPTGDHAATAPYGNLERSFDIVSLAKAAGAGFAARGDCYHTELTVSLIASGIKHQGSQSLTAPAYARPTTDVKTGTSAQSICSVGSAII